MRRISLILAAGALSLWSGFSALLAQEQERGLKERLLEPDETLAFKGWKNGFNSGKSSFSSSKARVREFQFEQKIRVENYVTRDFLGTKGAWEGDFLYQTEAASTEGRYIIPKKDSEYVTEQVKTEVPVEAEKKARVGEYETTEVQLRGKAQGSLDAQYNRDKQPMSIEDVRELLNRSE